VRFFEVQKQKYFEDGENEIFWIIPKPKKSTLYYKNVQILPILLFLVP